MDAEWVKRYGKSVSPQNLWLVIYYLHPNWNPKWHGELQVGIDPNIQYAEYQCLSNSMVAHVGYLGHSVNQLELGYDGHRDVFLSHWITE
jgi:hypothetical protein